ncbi:MAG: hypothetical protein GY793_09180, partial [Proteobacteria bacterium]|nr:hypothetical protein [Pseudomonadota bacterium]
EHLGESYDDAISAGYSFANAREYLLITGFHKFIKSKFMDKKAWTRTSTLWSDGYLVDGSWLDAIRGLKLRGGARVHRLAGGGPRELILA